MAARIAVPDLGPEMVGGVIAEWYRPDGAEVSPGEPVCRLECDYIAFEIEAEEPGVLRHRRPAGSIERKGAVLGFILQRGETVPPEEVGVEEREAEATGHRAGAATDVRDAGDGPAAGGAATSGEWMATTTEAAEAADGAKPAPPGTAPDAGVVVTFRRRAEEEAPARATAEPLPEPGGAIPGLPLWEEDDARAAADGAFAAASEVPPVSVEPAQAGATERFARIAAEAEARAEVLSGHVCVNWTRAFEAVAALGDEWEPHGPRPLVEDLAVRAIARALHEAGIAPGPAGLVLIGQDTERTFAVESPLDDEFRRMVEGRSAGCGTFERATWVVVSLIPLGVERIEPRLAGGQLAFGLGAGPGGAGTVTMRFDSRTLGEGDAGRVLARVRSLVENPYRLWG